jgi:hypothetical protein
LAPHSATHPASHSGAPMPRPRSAPAPDAPSRGSSPARTRRTTMPHPTDPRCARGRLRPHRYWTPKRRPARLQMRRRQTGQPRPSAMPYHRGTRHRRPSDPRHHQRKGQAPERQSPAMAARGVRTQSHLPAGVRPPRVARQCHHCARPASGSPRLRASPARSSQSGICRLPRRDRARSSTVTARSVLSRWVRHGTPRAPGAR